MRKLFLSLAFLATLAGHAQSNVQSPTPGSTPFVVPSLHNWTPVSGTLTLSGMKRVTYVGAEAENAARLLSTQLQQLKEQKKSLPITQGAWSKAGDVSLLIVQRQDLGEEGYELNITPVGVKACAQTAQGLVWAVQTLTQLLATQGELPCGTTTDVPEYKLRGFMIDCGRKHIPMSYLYETVRCMSALKMNCLQVHLNDNGFKKYFHNNWDETYAAFRLESEVFPELTARDGYYTKAEFRDFIKWAATMGVDVIPEIDAPAHALAFTHMRPEYGTEEFGVDHFDLFNPGVIPFLDSLYTEYLDGPDPIFAGPRVHIGTDEYSNKRKDATEKFREFTNHYIRLVKKYKKQPVIWGSLTHAKGTTPVDVEGVLMDCWSNGYADPDSMKQLGYQLVSIPDGWVYIVPAAGYYYDYLNTDLLYNHWTPANINGKQFKEHDPQIEGGMFAVWNDVCGNGISCFDIFHRVRPGMQAIAEKAWNTQKALPYAEWAKRVTTVPDYGNILVGELPQAAKGRVLTAVPKPNAPLVFNLEGDKKPYCLDLLGYDKVVEMLVTGDKEERGALLTTNGDTDFYLSDPVTGRIGYSRDGYLFSFDYALRPGEKHLLRFEMTNKATTLYVDGKLRQSLGPDERLAADKQPYNIIRTLSFPLQRTGTYRSKVEYIKVMEKK